MRGYRDQEIVMYTVERFFFFLIFKKFKKIIYLAPGPSCNTWDLLL